MKIAYKMFHVEYNLERKEFVDQADNAFIGADKFNSPTHKISNFNELQEFMTNNPEFKFDPNGYNLDGKQGWRYGELGIWASNWTAWNEFAKSDYDYLVLMEDDLFCSEGITSVVKKYIAECPSNFDALYIYVPADQIFKYNPASDVSEHLCIAYQDWSSACYVIQKKTIQRMIDVANSGISLPLDWFSFRQKNIFNIYTVKPTSNQPCFVKPIESTFQTTQEREIINGIF